MFVGHASALCINDLNVLPKVSAFRPGPSDLTYDHPAMLPIPTTSVIHQCIGSLYDL